MKGANFVSKLIFSYAFSSIQDGNPIITKYKIVVGSKEKASPMTLREPLVLGRMRRKMLEAVAELERMKVEKEFRRKQRQHKREN